MPFKQKKDQTKIDSPLLSIFLFTLFIFLTLSLHFDVTQDDAYISFRYAANYLTGKGLVYNYNERVEGYTNFLWIILLIISKGIFGIDYYIASKFLGVVFGELIFFLILFLLKDHFNKVPPIIYLSIIIAILSNLSIIYWATSSMETSAFAFISLLILIFEKRNPLITPVLVAIATLIRPEGVLIFLIILIHRLITKRNNFAYYICLYVILILPFTLFKIIYYGSLIPNTYYAKSGFELEYFKSGLNYIWDFLKVPGVYGVILILPLITIKRFWEKHSLLYLYILIYMMYILIVGGDVLKVYRFFVPIIPVLCFLFVISINELIILFRPPTKLLNILVLIIVSIYSTFAFLPSYKYAKDSQNLELGLINNMHFISYMLKKHMGNDFTIACSTIGMIGYQLMGHRVIDMLGLTDAYIARNPEKIEGIESSWKERRFNSKYILEQQPDFILFSTNYKPSAPAERALMLHSEFRKKYSLTGFKYQAIMPLIWERTDNIDLSKDTLHNDVMFVNKMVDGLNLIDLLPQTALMNLQEAHNRLGEDYPIILSSIGNCYLGMNQLDSAITYARKVLEIDPSFLLARWDIIRMALKIGDTATAVKQVELIQQQHPWLFDKSYIPPKDIRLTESF